MKWLHRIGYICTAIVFCFLLAAAYFQLQIWFYHHHRISLEMDRTRTNSGPLSQKDNSLVTGNAIAMLRALPPLNARYGNELRYAIMPSFASNWFALAIFYNGATKAEGHFITFKAQYPSPGVRALPTILSEQKITASAADYINLANQIDALTVGYQGDRVDCLDGAPMVFERADKAGIRSGAGNCSEHYRKIASLINRFVNEKTNLKGLLNNEKFWRP